MKKVLHHIRKQPEHVKTRYVVVFAILATAVVITVWLITLQFIKKNDDTIKTESPFVMIKDIFKGQVSDLQKNLPEKQTSISDTLGAITSDDTLDTSDKTTETYETTNTESIQSETTSQSVPENTDSEMH